MSKVLKGTRLALAGAILGSAIAGIVGAIIGHGGTPVDIIGAVAGGGTVLALLKAHLIAV